MHTLVKYPENRELKKMLKHGDTKVLAERTGYKKNTIGVILNGRRPMPDALASEIVKLLKERKEIKHQIGMLLLNDSLK